MFPGLEATIEFDAGFTATLVLHPATYLNKVLVSSSEGTMQLWNIRTQSVFILDQMISLLTNYMDGLPGHAFTNSHPQISFRRRFLITLLMLLRAQSLH